MWSKSISLYAYLVLVFILIFANFNIKRWHNNEVIVWDIIGYYAYLPGSFIYHDYKLNFLKEGLPLDEEVKFWPLNAPNGNFIHKYTMGMAVMYSPFFFLAHIHTQVAELKTNGFSWYYQKYLHLSCLFYLIIGLFFLRKLLLQWFAEWPVALTMVSVTLGTNLFFYASTEAAMSHAYNFSLAAILMYCVHCWFTMSKIRYALGIGITLGLLILIRPINLLFALFPLLYSVNRFEDITKNIKLFFSKPFQLIIVIFFCILIVSPQFLYWKSITGQFFFFSYVGEHFYFLKPKIIEGMFSFRNGWLIYTPIMVFSILGVYQLIIQKFHTTVAIITIFIIYLFVVFSWWCWWYVGFGNRAMIDIYSLLAIPLAAFFSKILMLINFKKWTMLTIIFLLITLNLFQTLQYRMGLVHFDSMNFQAYIASFGKLRYTEEYKNALQQPDYEKAKSGE